MTLNYQLAFYKLCPRCNHAIPDVIDACLFCNLDTDPKDDDPADCDSQADGFKEA